MKHFLLFTLLLFGVLVNAQTKVSGTVVDEEGEPVAYANVLFKNTTEGTITDEDGRFYLESDENYTILSVSFIGYTTEEVVLEQRVTYNLVVTLREGEQLDEVVVYVGKQSKKNNPAIDILKKIWANKKINGLRKFSQYKYDKYEKIEFDLNTIDSALIKSRIFK
ncbi:MAG: carboxypeptidase-like regulatory domain-containing protein, partial [Eudoraea sp.]|nr:carboxypeptidase-like regulatory domain-containing protein [Eudoraea sp.]